jgi:lysophospholipase L1-like esterase
MTFKRRLLDSFMLIYTLGLIIPACGQSSERPAKNSAYLALGDSLAFGYTPAAPLGDLADYHGYPQIVASQYPLQLTNPSCFGETSGHFVNLSSLPDLGCAAWRASLPIFVTYGPTETQLDYAVTFLKQNKHTGLVTIDIGINDLGVLLDLTCAGNTTCAVQGEAGVLAAYAQHLIEIYSSIRGTGYAGPIVAVTGYAFNYSDPTELLGIVPLNAVLVGITDAFGGKIADAFTAFGIAAAAYQGNTCATGLLVETSPGVCDTHPSAAGHALIAETVLKQISH